MSDGMDYTHYTLADFLADESFQAYALGTDPEQVAFWRNWLVLHPEKAYDADHAVELLQFMSTARKPAEPGLKEEEWEKMRSRLAQPNIVVNHNLGRTRWLRYAAALTGLLLLASGWLWTTGYFTTVRYTTAYGETREVTLPDSSVVVLNANSSLRYPSDWAGNADREVWLDGEAYFSVRKASPSRPDRSRSRIKFTVHTPDLNVEVLGTQFTVSKRHTRTLVTLNEGQIRLDVPAETQPRRMVMQPGDQVEYLKDRRKLTRKAVRPEVYSSWTRNVWILDGMPLSEVTQRMEETYGLKVRIADRALAAEKMTGVVPANNLNVLLEGLATIFQMQVERQDQTIILHP
jgi:ferric-dicitrate binding protein FerR (iron transport regulator)